MLAEALGFGVLQVTVTLCINTNTLTYCEKLDVLAGLITIVIKGMLWIF
jgi:hypothetical protein